jgi:hypothetical protein
MRIESAIVWGAQAASLQFAAACREHLPRQRLFVRNFFDDKYGRPASCRTVQAGSLRSPKLGAPRAYGSITKE